MSTKGANYDSFCSLSPAEQARIRKNWMIHDKGATSRDEVEATGCRCPNGWL